MATVYFVNYALHNAENDGWAYKIVGKYDDLASAKKEYHSQLSQYIGSTVFDHVSVILYDSNSNIYMLENWDAPTSTTEETETE